MTPGLGYFLNSASRRIARRGMACPSCGARGAEVLARKALVTTLVRCSACALQFRSPTTPKSASNEFYQEEYDEGFTSTMPTHSELQELCESRFKGSGKDYAAIVALLKAAGAPEKGRLFDLGCSWGYGSWQLTQAGYRVQSFEVSKPRGRFAAEHLGVQLAPDLEAAEGPFDVFFSSHVLEHVPNLSETIKLAFSKLKPGGLFVALTPNGCQAHKQAAPESWLRLWGEVHPNFLDDRFYASQLEGIEHLLSSSPHDLERVAAWSRGEAVDRDPAQFTGGELLVIARKP